MLSPDTDPQLRILRTFTVLHQLRPTWPGHLVLNLGLDPTGEAISFAANIAGAVCLSLEPDPALLRNAQRTGSCDFIVNTLDEAVRAMKNEIRKHRPLSVALEGNPESILAEIIARGLAPALFTAAVSHPEAATHFQALGAQIVSFDDHSINGIVEPVLATRHWQLATFRFTTVAELRAFDTRALAQLAQLSTDPADILRRQWLLTAPRILPRDRHRTLWLTSKETQALQTQPS